MLFGRAVGFLAELLLAAVWADFDALVEDVGFDLAMSLYWIKLRYLLQIKELPYYPSRCSAADSEFISAYDRIETQGKPASANPGGWSKP